MSPDAGPVVGARLAAVRRARVRALLRPGKAAWALRGGLGGAAAALLVRVLLRPSYDLLGALALVVVAGLALRWLEHLELVRTLLDEGLAGELEAVAETVASHERQLQVHAAQVQQLANRTRAPEARPAVELPPHFRRMP